MASSSRAPPPPPTPSTPAFQTPSHLAAYTEGELIGQGSFGVIHKVTRKSDGLPLARKQLNFSKMTQRDKQQLVAEVNILSKLQHPNIVGFIERILDQDRGIIYILMEYCGGGDLSHVIRECERTGRQLSEDTVWDYFYQIAGALKHCHSGGGSGGGEEEGEGERPPSRGTAGRRRESGKERERVLHRDLKPDNVFLDESRENVKLGDFGLSKALGAASFANTYVGTPYYMSPELFSESAYDAKSDIWALGCVIYEMVALHPPFHLAKTHNDLANQLRSQRIPPLPRRVSPNLRDVILRMLAFDPKQRPSAADLLSHPMMDVVRRNREMSKTRALMKDRAAQLVERESSLLMRETMLAEREDRCGALERKLAAARRAVDGEREALRAERERWDDERRSVALAARRPSSGAAGAVGLAGIGAGDQSPTDMEGVMDIPGSAVKALGGGASRVPRRSFVPKPLEERNLPTGATHARSRESCVFDLATPTKPAFSAANLAPSSLRRAGTPSRLASKSMGNLAAAARADRTRSGGGAGGAGGGEDEFGSTAMADTTMASARKLGMSVAGSGGGDARSLGRSSAAPPARRPSPTNPFLGGGAAGERYERPPSRPPLPTTSSSSSGATGGFHMPSSASSSSLATIERQLYPHASPARWLEKENDGVELPSPFLRKTADVLGPSSSSSSSFSSSARPNMPRSRSTAGLTAQAGPSLASTAGGAGGLARMAMGNAMRTEARPAVAHRSTRLGAVGGGSAYERRESLARAEQAYEEAGRVMAGH